MSYPLYGNVYLGNVSGNIKLHVHAFEGNSTGIGYNNDSMTFGINQTALDTPKMSINKIGDMDILGNISTGRNIVVNSTTASTSTTSGALKVAGGLGIGGNLNVGGFSKFAFDSSFNGNIQLTQANNPLWFVSKNTSTFTPLGSGDDFGILYGTPTYPAPAGLIISPRGIGNTGGGIKLDMHGNVGIGKHPTEKLDVNGMVRSSDLRIDNGNIHLGQNAGLSQGANSIAIGYSAGQTTQGIRSIAIGDYAGSSTQGHNSIAIGRLATTGIGGNSIAIGSGATTGIGGNSIAIGRLATTGIGGNSIAIGFGASTGIYGNSVAIGLNASAGADNQIMLGTVSETVRIPGKIIYNNPPFLAYSYTATTQSITNVTNTILNWPTADATNGTLTGITYSTGTFTNANSYSVLVNVNATIVYNFNVNGIRAMFISSTSGQKTLTNVSPSALDNTGINTSSSFVLAAAATFSVSVYQSSGVPLNVGFINGSSISRISVIVM